MNKLKKVISSILVLIFAAASNSVFAEEPEELFNINSSWSNVMPGKVICTPAFTSYGFVFITDARNIMSYSNNGKFLWEKRIPRTNSASIAVLPHDFILLITNSKKTLTLLNPSGSTLWSKDFNAPIETKPFAGRDGRFFVKTETSLYCFGITGQQKWKLDLPKMNKFEIQEFEDGSILVFLNELTEGKTKGLRISPFGEPLEEITFTGEVSTAITSQQGILLTFKDSTCTLLTITDNHAWQKWVLQKENTHPKINYDFFVLTPNDETVIYLNHWTNKIEVDFLNLAEGQITKSFFTDNLKTVAESVCTQNGLFLTDGKEAYFYSPYGVEIWSGKLPSSTSHEAWNYCAYTQNDYFVIFSKNWNMNAFRTAQSAASAQNNAANHSTQSTKSASSKNEQTNYNKFYSINTEIYSNYYQTSLNKNLANEERIELIKAGNYGAKEKEWSSELISACYALQSALSTTNFGARVEKSGFETDTAGVELILKQLPLWGTDTYCDFTAYFLKKEDNNSLIHTLLQGISQNAYDPDGVILNTLEQLAEKSNARNEIILEDICDAVYDICLFMGLPVFNTKGKQILSSLLYPKYSSKTRLYARETLKKVSALDL